MVKLKVDSYNNIVEEVNIVRKEFRDKDGVSA